MNLLIIDDEQIVREGLKTIFPWAEYGFTVCGEAKNGEEGVSLIRSLNPDLVLLDIRLPKLDGLEVLKTVREEGFGGQIIILSGYADFDYAKTAIRLGVCSYLKQAKETLEKEKRESDQALKSPEQVRRELLLDILNGGAEHKREELLACSMDLTADAYQVLLVVIKDRKPDGPGDMLCKWLQTLNSVSVSEGGCTICCLEERRSARPPIPCFRIPAFFYPTAEWDLMLLRFPSLPPRPEKAMNTGSSSARTVSPSSAV